jgi:hypothetical protein
LADDVEGLQECFVELLQLVGNVDLDPGCSEDDMAVAGFGENVVDLLDVVKVEPHRRESVGEAMG